MPTISQLVVGWGPGMVIILGGGYLVKWFGGKFLDSWTKQQEQKLEIATKFAERFLASQEQQATAFQHIATSMDEQHDLQRDTTVALQALSLKIEELKTDVRHGGRAAAAGA